jgi:structural maintenance of chromosome 4
MTNCIFLLKGRLGSLGTIPDKYDVAISTACPQLHNMVVDTVEQGQTCIGYLRSQNVGRASFMILQKIAPSNGMQPIATPENVPRLFDLVKPKDPRFAAVFYKALGNTLVAENMDQANRIAYGQRRWKVVTLTGQLIEISGTMSGGGGQPARGGMSSKLAADAVRPEVLRGYEKDSEDAARHLEEAVRAVRAAEEELDRLKTSGPQIEVAYQKLSLDLENGKGRIAEAEKRVRDLK